MRRLLTIVFGLATLLIAACAPTTVTPQQTEELVTQMAFRDAFSAVVNVINTQPYPSNSGGWVIVDSDQVGGFVRAQLNGQECSFFGGCTPYVATVSVALVERSDGGTAVNLSLSRHDESAKLATAIRARLGV